MDKIDEEWNYWMNKFKVGTYYELKDILLPQKEMERFVNRLFIYNKRKYVDLYNIDVYAELTGKPNWHNLKFKIVKDSYIQKYYSSITSKQYKLDL